ncbi:MAG: MarR family transcriptional regulator [Bacteroidetes bacterium]|nr:MarR family transcriptional regulator [Bacteroidota bacterium]
MIFTQKYHILKQIAFIANRWQENADKLVEKQLGITVKQWMLLSILEEEFKNHLPTIGQASEVSGTSRQNIKRLANELQKKDFLIIASDPKDHRMLRLALTGKHRDFFSKNKNQELFELLSKEYFENMEDTEIMSLEQSVDKIYQKMK